MLICRASPALRTIARAPPALWGAGAGPGGRGHTPAGSSEPAGPFRGARVGGAPRRGGGGRSRRVACPALGAAGFLAVLGRGRRGGRGLLPVSKGGVGPGGFAV